MNTSVDAFSAALAHHRSGNADAAAACYRQALRDQPDNFDAAFNLAALLAGQRQFEAALDLYEQMLARTPDDADILSNLGNLLLTMERFDEAEGHYRQALAADPFLAHPHSNLGNLMLRQGRADAAVPHYRMALELDPFEAATHNNLGTALKQLGDTEGARTHYEQAIRRDPAAADSYMNLGNLLVSLGQPDDAAALFQRAAELAPDSPLALVNLALAHERAGRMAEAEALFRRACVLAPELVEAWQGLASILHHEKRYEECRTVLEEALRLDPDNAVTAHHFGGLCMALEDGSGAVLHFARACELQPDSPDMLNAYGNVLHECQRSADAVPIFERALTMKPEFPEALNNIANALVNLGRRDEAIAHYERSLELDPSRAAVACNLGNVQREFGRFAKAVHWFEHALQHDRELANAYNGIGLTLQAENRHRDAIKAYEQALAIRPEYVEALNNMAISQTELGDYGNAIKTYNRIIDIKPGMIQVYFNMGNLLQHVGRWDESITVFYKALEVQPGHHATYPFLAHSLMQQCSWRNLNSIVERIRQNIEEELAIGGGVSVSAFALQSMPGDFSMALRQQVAERICSGAENGTRELREELGFSHARTRRHERLRIGYMSPDFRFHSVAVAFMGLLQNHDRERFELYGYSLHAGPDDNMTTQLKAGFTGFHRLADLSVRDAAQQIFDDEIDILIDLAGHTRGTRLDLLALRPAPVQVHYLGYSATIGAKFLDYVITDHHQVPPEQRPFFTEQLAYLPDTFMATHKAPVADERPSRAECGLPDEGFVFANFNGCYKFDPDTFAIWMRLLRKVPGSVLWTMAGTPGSRKNLRLEAAARGIDPDRLVFADKTAHPQHLARIVHADLGLDNRYHGGGVTTVDCLWMSVPVLTLAGPTPQSRNGATLLSAIGLEELITERMDDYERLALALAHEPQRLADLKARLRANRDTHPLFDDRRLTQNLEQIYDRMWANYMAGSTELIDLRPEDSGAKS